MTFMGLLDLDLKFLKMYLRTKMKFLAAGFEKLEHKQDGQNAFGSCDLGLSPMTLIYELDLDILKMSLCTKT